MFLTYCVSIHKWFCMREWNDKFFMILGCQSPWMQNQDKGKCEYCSVLIVATKNSKIMAVLERGHGLGVQILRDARKSKLPYCGIHLCLLYWNTATFPGWGLTEWFLSWKYYTISFLLSNRWSTDKMSFALCFLRFRFLRLQSCDAESYL